MNRFNRELRREVLLAYGNVCACCGEKEEIFLAIDHVNNDGAEHRRELRGVSSAFFYRWLKKNGFPPGFQTLCHNCNWAKSRGGCPHQRQHGAVAIPTLAAEVAVDTGVPNDPTLDEEDPLS